MNKKNKAYAEYIGVFLISVLPKIWLALQAYPLKTFSDEVASIASAAALAGYDWSAVVSQAGYYGAGFYWIFAPVFMLTDDPIVIYRVMLAGCCIMQALIAPICYYMLNHYFDIKDASSKIIISFCCSYLVMTRATILFNEHILIVLVWLSVLVLAKIQEYQNNRLKKRIYTANLMLIFGYSMTIHTRMLTFWIALVLLLVAYCIVERRFFLSISVLLFVGTGGYWLSQKVVAFVQSSLWSAENGGELRNATVSVALKHDFLSLRTWKAWISIIIGQLQMVNLVTGGLAVLILVFFCVYFVRWMQHKKAGNEKKEDLIYAIIIFFCVCCTGMTIGAQSLSWLAGATAGIGHGYNSVDYGLKAYTYLRYFGLYTGPMLMCGLVMIQQYWKENRLVVMLSVPMSMFFFIAWIVLIQPFIFENRDTSEFFSGISLYYATDKVELRHYVIGLLFVLLAGCVIYALIWKDNYVQMLIILSVYLFAQYYLNGMAYEVNRQKRNWTEKNGGYYFVKEIEERMDLPSVIYCYDGEDRTDHFLFYPYQFYLNRYKIIPVYENNVADTPKGEVVFSNIENEQILLDKGYQCFSVDENEYVYVDEGNEDLYEYLKMQSSFQW